jgi:halimadienyl-diphosphate synthase
VANSPSATAYFALQLQPNNKTARNYINQVVSHDGGAPDFAPIDIFEIAWTLWNLRLIPDVKSHFEVKIQSHLDFLETYWKTDTGIGTASNGTIKDGDDSGLVYEVLSYYGRQKDIGAILYYEEETHFRCFALESNPSISTNIHILGALRQAGYEIDHPSVQKIFEFLKSFSTSSGFWFDKWHASPYYATSHAIITCSGYDDALVKKAVDWIVQTQNDNGSWGYYETPTSEETAYCIQALCAWERYNKNIHSYNSIKRATKWLSENNDKSGTPLWIGKALYCPDKVVKSSVLSALIIGSNWL